MKYSPGKIKRKLLLASLSIVFLAVALWVAGAERIFDDLKKFTLGELLGMCGLFGLNLIVVSLRLERILSHFGMSVPLRIAARASISGHVASLFFISLFGQVFGRHFILRRFGVRPVIIASLMVYERSILLLLGAGLGAVGVVLLMDRQIIFDFLKGVSFPEIMLIAGGGLILSFALGRSKFESLVISRTFSLANVTNVLEIVSITLIGQLMVLGAFVLGILALKPGIDIVDALAASAIISFAASMPVSVNGWGVRELAAVYVLGQLGMDSSSAVAVSIVVGLCSTAVVAAAGPLALAKRTEQPVELPLPSAEPDPNKIDMEKVASWIITTAAAAVIFFQVHMAMPGGTVNLNLADPLAILALTVMAIHLVSDRRLPSWRYDKFNLFIILFSILLLFSFVRGALVIGVTQWALGSRLIGWLVILGYLSLGYFASAYFGASGRRRLFVTIISTAIAVIVFQILLRWLHYSGLLVGLNFPENFQGYSANRNAFAFQLLVGSILIMSYSVIYIRATAHASYTSNRSNAVPKSRMPFILKRHMWVSAVQVISFLHGILIAGIVFSGSRAGLLTCGVLLAFNWLLKWVDRRVIGLSVAYAFLAWVLAQTIWLLPSLNWGELIHSGDLRNISHLGGLSNFHSGFSSDSSNIERWKSILLGIQMWLDSPIFGAGLGVFINRSTEWSDLPLVIHSTPVWLLAEFGLIGAGLCLWGLVILFRCAYSRGCGTVPQRIVVTLLIGFTVFGLVHEIFYQRIFWMVLGAALAITPTSKTINPKTGATSQV